MKKLLLIFCFFMGMTLVLAKEEVSFSRCVDGDTFKVFIDKQEITVRLLAVDTPETVKSGTDIEYYGKEASDFTCNMVSKASKIELEYDNNSDKTDKYGRYLAWVFVDDYLLQELLIVDGYASVAYLYGDYKYTALLQDKEATAQMQKKGIWDEVKRREWVKKQSDEDKMTIKDVLIIIVILVLGYFCKEFRKKLKKYKKNVLKI